MRTDNALGEFLRAHREALLPGSVGLSLGVRVRRVPGLRREEVAQLAGISHEYYLRLEQGRERHPSAQVLGGIARALNLDPHSEEFLRRLVDPAPLKLVSESGVYPDLTAFLNSLQGTPAFAHDRILTVTIANPLARLLSPSFAPGVNLLRAMFLDPPLRALYLNHDDTARRLVNYVRAQATLPIADERVPALVDELSAASEEFASLWARYDVMPDSSGVNNLQHPIVGRIDLHFERLCHAGSTDPVIVMYHADPGSASSEALRRLAELASL